MDAKTNKILQEINMITTNIQNNYPELSAYLEENPSTIPDLNELADNNFEDYLKSLKALLKNHMKTHSLAHPLTPLP